MQLSRTGKLGLRLLARLRARYATDQMLMMPQIFQLRCIIKISAYFDIIIGLIKAYITLGIVQLNVGTVVVCHFEHERKKDKISYMYMYALFPCVKIASGAKKLRSA